jgi:hypothetical protein
MNPLEEEMPAKIVHVGRFDGRDGAAIAVYRLHRSLLLITCEVYRCDFRRFLPETPYDLVGSFGLVEHFLAPEQI